MKYPEAKHPNLYAAAYRATERREAKKRDMRVYGADLIPEQGAALLGYSHREASDPRVAGVVLDRAVYLMAKKELWTIKYFYFGYLLQLINAFPVDREHAGPSTIRHAGELIDQGRLVGVFGEETRYEDREKKLVRSDRIGEIQPGLGFLAVKFDVAIYPIGISHLTPDEVESYGRDVKRVVVGLPDYHNPELPKKEAITDITNRHRESLQNVFDVAQAMARQDARKAF